MCSWCQSDKIHLVKMSLAVNEVMEDVCLTFEWLNTSCQNVSSNKGLEGIWHSRISHKKGHGKLCRVWHEPKQLHPSVNPIFYRNAWLGTKTSQLFLSVPPFKERYRMLQRSGCWSMWFSANMSRLGYLINPSPGPGPLPRLLCCWCLIAFVFCFVLFC